MFNSDYNVQDVLKDYQKQVEGDITYALVEESYCSPAVKRAVWQTLLIIKEIRDTLGGMPEKIFVEVTRQEQSKNRTKSRKNNLLALYQSKDFKASTTNMAADVEKLLQKLNDDDDLKLRSDKYYLYYMQLVHPAAVTNHLLLQYSKKVFFSIRLHNNVGDFSAIKLFYHRENINYIFCIVEKAFYGDILL